MLIQFWERLCGYHKWVPANATVLSSNLAGIGLDGAVEDKRQNGKIVVGWESHCKIAWRDQHGAVHNALFAVDEESPLYQLCDGDTVEIRFNPKKPADYYLPGLLEAKIVSMWKFGLFAVMIALVCIALAVAWLGPDVLLRAISH